MSRRTVLLLALLMTVSVLGSAGATAAPSAQSSAASGVERGAASAVAARGAGDPIGKRCTRFRGARRCASWSLPTDPDVPRTPYATVTVRVFNGDDAEVRTALFQRRTKNGWVTVARGSGSGVRTYYASNSAVWRTCANLPGGTYRSRGKVRWTSEGVRYTRWVTGTKVGKRALC